MTSTRIPTAVDTVADNYVDAWMAHDPLLATYVGIAGHDAELPALDPDWLEEQSQLRRTTLRDLAEATPVDANDRITVAAMTESIGAAEALRAAGTEESDIKNIASPLQNIRDVFDLMATATPDDWDTIATRMSLVPTSVDGYIASLAAALARGDVRARRQVQAGINQSNDNVGPDGFFEKFARNASATDGGELPASLREDLARGAVAASAAYAKLAEFLSTELLPNAPEPDGVGRERYALFSRAFLGSQVDLEETYQWGQQELARVRDLMQQTAQRIKPGASIEQAMHVLDTDPARTLHSTDALKAWMQGKSDAAVAALADTHFDIPQPIRRLECLIAPTQQGGIYYTGPSEDLVTRPGQMWWSVPKGEHEFTTWKQLSTVYHEGVPGHHLQVAQTAYRRDLLNRWRRLISWVSGHGEGWALYAERLMEELGFLDDPGDLMGMLDSQSFRAARVVIDIGVHCEFEAPASVGGGSWTWDKAWEFLSANVSSSEGTRRFELTRYLGWPGQAPSYKIGERLWLQLRDDAQIKQGDAFDLKSFHRSALDVGSVGLDVLRSAVLGEFD